MHTERIGSTKPRAERYSRQPDHAPTDHGRDGCGRGGKVVPVDDVALPATAVQGGLCRLFQSAWPVGDEVETARGVMPRGYYSNSTKLRFSRKFPPHSRHHSPAYPVPSSPRMVDALHCRNREKNFSPGHRECTTYLQVYVIKFRLSSRAPPVTPPNLHHPPFRATAAVCRPSPIRSRPALERLEAHHAGC